MTANGKTEAKTEIIRASELQARVVDHIAEIRNPEPRSSYRAELRRYKRRLGRREEVVRVKGEGLLGAREERGFWKYVYGDQKVFITRPEPPRPTAYAYWAYDRSFGTTSHARVVGLLADARCNRELRPGRVAEYQEEMRAGRWRDLLSDPIAITAEGDVLNGQHRIAAATRVDWTKAGNDPTFLVVWGAGPQEALHADGSRRTPRDEKTIAARLLDGKDAS